MTTATRYFMPISTYRHLVDWTISGLAPVPNGDQDAAFELAEVIRRFVESFDEDEAIELLDRSTWPELHYLATRIL
jgi:hypothetical protein